MTSNGLLLELLSHAPTDEALQGVLTHMDLPTLQGGMGQLEHTPGRLDAAGAALRWKNGKCPVETGTLVALLCGDPSFLEIMATKESRQNVLTALAANPHLPLTGIVRIHAKLTYTQHTRRGITPRVHQHALNAELQTLADAHKGLLGSAYVTHPEHTEDSLLALLGEEAVLSQSWAVLVAQHPDLFLFPRVVDLLVERSVLSTHLCSTLITRHDVRQFSLAHFRELVSQGHGYSCVGAKDLGVDKLTILVEDAQERRPDTTTFHGSDAVRYRRFWEGYVLREDAVLSHLRLVPFSAGGVAALGRLLAAEYPDHQSVWEIASGLLGSVAIHQSAGDLLDAVGALLD